MVHDCDKCHAKFLCYTEASNNSYCEIKIPLPFGGELELVVTEVGEEMYEDGIKFARFLHMQVAAGWVDAMRKEFERLDDMSFDALKKEPWHDELERY